MPIWHRKLTEQIERRVANPAIAALLRRWHAQRPQAGAQGLAPSVPEVATFALAALSTDLAELAPDLMLLEPQGDDWRYRHYGSAIARQSGFDMTGRLVSSFGGEIAEFFLSCYQECTRRGAPLYTVHYADRARNVFTWERLLMPLADASGAPWLLVYNRPLQSRLDLQQQVLNASGDAILALQALRDDQGRQQDWLVLMLNDAMAALVGLARPAATGQRVGEVLLRWSELGLDAACRAVAGAGRLMPDVVRGHEQEIALTVASQPHVFSAQIRPLGRGVGDAVGDGCVLRLADLGERHTQERAVRDARHEARLAARARERAERRLALLVQGLQAALAAPIAEPTSEPGLESTARLRATLQSLLAAADAADAGDTPADTAAMDLGALQPTRPVPPAEPPPPSTTAAPAPQVLVVEDDPVNQLVLRRQLELLGCAVLLADDGAQALELWQQAVHAGTAPAMVLSDVHMPVMDGHAFAQALRRRETAQLRERLPMLAISANAQPADLQTALAAGMDGVLAKPVQLGALRQALARWLPPGAPAPMPAAPAGSDPVAVLDLDVLRHLLGHDEAAVRELLADYRRSAERLAEEMRAAFRRGEASQLAAMAHKLKSASNAVGAQPLAQLCAQLERRPWTGDDPAAVAAGLAAFDAAVAAVTSRIDAHLRRSTA